MKLLKRDKRASDFCLFPDLMSQSMNSLQQLFLKKFITNSDRNLFSNFQDVKPMKTKKNSEIKINKMTSLDYFSYV